MSAEQDFNRLIGLPTPRQVRAAAENLGRSRAKDKAVAEGRRKVVGRTDVIRGTRVTCIEADPRTGVVLERAEDEEADLREAWPEGGKVRVGGHYFTVASASARRVTLKPYGANRDGTPAKVTLKGRTFALNRAQRRQLKRTGGLGPLSRE